VLSMGAVFATFAGFYYWIGVMYSLRVNMFWAKLHFWVFFLGVNMTFFPMHFLGLAGMPRRIPVYPACYSGWNYISSLGSWLSVLSILLFLKVLYELYFPSNDIVGTRNTVKIFNSSRLQKFHKIFKV
jgi:cytochrome c oxidase subunit 1